MSNSKKKVQNAIDNSSRTALT